MSASTLQIHQLPSGTGTHVETQLVSDLDNEVVDEEEMTTRLIEGYENEVVLDTDDEEMQTTGIVGRTRRIVGVAMDANQRPSSDHFKQINGFKSSPGFSQIGFEEPEELLEAKALHFVDRFLSANKENLPHVDEPLKTVMESSSSVSAGKGLQSLAKRINQVRNHMSGLGNFQWHERNEDVVQHFPQRKEAFSKCAGTRKSSILGILKVDDLGSEKDGGLGREKYEDCCPMEEVTLSTNPNTYLVKHAATEDNMVLSESENMRRSAGQCLEQRDTKSLQQHLANSFIEIDTSAMFDVGIGTQMAAEAMQALCSGTPAYCHLDDAYKGPQDTLEKSSKMAKVKKFSANAVSKARTCASIEVKPGRSKQVKGLPERVSNRHISLGNRISAGKTWKSPPAGCQVRQSKPLSSLRIAGNNPDSSTENTFLKGRRKRKSLHGNLLLVPAGTKCSSLSGATSREAAKNQQGENDVVSSTMRNYLKLERWDHPRGKRTRQSLRCHQNRYRRLCTSSRTGDGERDNDETVNDQGKSTGDIKNCYLKVYTRKRSARSFSNCISSEMNSERSLSKPHSVEPRAVGAPNSVGISKRTVPPVPLNGPPACRFSKVCSMNSLSSGSVRDERENQKKLSSTEKVNLCSESSVPSSHFINKEVPPIATGGERTERLHNKKRTRSSLEKELLRLGICESMPNLPLNSLRKRRDAADVRVSSRLGISIASSCLDATHFITDKFVRTRNMLEAMALGKPVVTHVWLENCGQARSLIDEKDYILRDAKKETEIGFSMPVSLARAKKHPLLLGQRVLITPTVKPDVELISSLVRAVHGQVIGMTRGISDETPPDDLFVLSCEDDYAVCAPLLKKGIAVYSAELLLNGIVIQKLEYKRHQLFQDQNKRNCSRT
ncbi:BRCT domain [Dillenia turbinata]|uniref:BRCT domain n=1 Tax=Dillenia turbinata TaxID=194707 RepID=A0AAN8ZGR7_9MAGN